MGKHPHAEIQVAGRAAIDRSIGPPEARLLWASDQARRGNADAALKEYKALAQEGRKDLAVAALFNAGNLQLRQALKDGPAAVGRSLPLVELAKQSYRSALRIAPQSWDARYNLERALWLAPEIELTYDE